MGMGVGVSQVMCVVTFIEEDSVRYDTDETDVLGSNLHVERTCLEGQVV